MHEASIMQNVFDLAFAHMQAASATRVVRVRLRVGALSGVVPESLAFAFEAMKPDTPAAEATLDIDRVATELACRACGFAFTSAEFPAPCPACGAWGGDVRHGTELDLVSVEFSR